MNVFFIIGDKAITPTLDQGTILAGVTRDSTIQLLHDMGVEVEERRLSVDEIEDAYRSGDLHEVFGTGTAVTRERSGRRADLRPAAGRRERRIVAVAADIADCVGRRLPAAEPSRLRCESG